jgi:hypothetical protein
MVLTGPAARIPAETPKAVNVRLARETMEPRQTEFMSQGRHSCQRPFPSRVQSEKALDVAIYETCECESLSGGHCKQLRVEHLSAGRSARRRERRTRIFS